LLGAPLDGIPETSTVNEVRTEQTRARHRSLLASQVISELENATANVRTVLDAMEPAELDAAELTWFGADMTVATVCIVRAFETWTHADDIRRATTRPHTPPPAPSLATMSDRAVGWTSLMLALGGTDVGPGTAVIDLQGPGGGKHIVQLRADVGSLDDDPRFTLRMDVVQYCRAVGRRFPPGGVEYDVDGDDELAQQLIAALPNLAQL
jgi:hypothetical protein